MIQGTTPTHIFELPINPADIKELRITYAQESRPILTKKTGDCQMGGIADKYTVTVKLTQQETFGFKSGKPVEIQMRVMKLNGDVLASELLRTSVGRCLGNEVIK